MRQLYWKEWREQRFLPLVMTAVTLVLNGVWAYIAYRINLASGHGGIHAHMAINSSRSGGDGISLKNILEGSVGVLFAMWMLGGALAGAGGVATEVGTGTIKFLFSLPVKRETLWRVKILTALGTLAATLLLSGFCLVLMDIALYGSATMSTAWIGKSHSADVPFLEAVLLAFAFAFTASTFVDRTISALLTAIISGPVVYGCLLAWEQVGLHRLFPALKTASFDTATSLLPIFVLGVLTAISYAVFVHGGPLTTAKRFKVGAIAGGAALLAASAAFLASSPILVHLR